MNNFNYEDDGEANNLPIFALSVVALIVIFIIVASTRALEYTVYFKTNNAEAIYTYKRKDREKAIFAAKKIVQDSTTIQQVSVEKVTLFNRDKEKKEIIFHYKKNK